MTEPLAKIQNHPDLENANNLMTVPKLRDYLFGGPQVPFWNYDPRLITVGLEIEYFIARVSEHDSPSLASYDDYFRFLHHLQHHSNFRDLGLPDQPGRVSRDTSRGFVAIKPDFAWHILEISLPPRSDLQDLRTLIEEVFAEVDRSLHATGLIRLDTSAWPHIPEKMDLVNNQRLAGSDGCLARQNKSKITYTPQFPALITATHVHINAATEESLTLLPALFHLDPYISAKFTRRTTFQGHEFSDLRKELYSVNLGEDYHLHTVPKEVPDSLEKICQLMNRSRPTFPNDRFFPVRNMCFIRPSRHGTIEFRSSCSYLSVKMLLDITRWRIAQLITASNVALGRKLRESTLAPQIDTLYEQIRLAE